MGRMWVDGAALVMVLFYGVMGYRYGLTGALINLAGMIGGYLAAVWYARPAAVELAARTALAPLLALPLASLLIFLVVTRAFYLLHLIVRKLLGEDDKNGPSPLLTMDKVGGLGFGLLKGTAIVGFVLWGLPTLIGSGALAGQVGLAESTAAGVVRTVLETTSRYAFGMVTDDPNAQAVLAHAVAQPRAALQEAAGLVNNPALKTCLSDPEVQQKLKSQDVQGFVNSRSFETLVADPGIQKSLKSLGFQPQSGTQLSRGEVGLSVMAVSTQMKTQLTKLQSAASTQEVQAFLADPKVQEQLKKGELVAVMNDPRLTKILGLTPEALAAARDAQPRR